MASWDSPLQPYGDQRAKTSSFSVKDEGAAGNDQLMNYCYNGAEAFDGPRHIHDSFSPNYLHFGHQSDYSWQLEHSTIPFANRQVHSQTLFAHRQHSIDLPLSVQPQNHQQHQRVFFCQHQHETYHPQLNNIWAPLSLPHLNAEQYTAPPFDTPWASEDLNRYEPVPWSGNRQEVDLANQANGISPQNWSQLAGYQRAPATAPAFGQAQIAQEFRQQILDTQPGFRCVSNGKDKFKSVLDILDKSKFKYKPHTRVYTRHLKLVSRTYTDEDAQRLLPLMPEEWSAKFVEETKQNAEIILKIQKEKEERSRKEQEVCKGSNRKEQEEREQFARKEKNHNVKKEGDPLRQTKKEGFYVMGKMISAVDKEPPGGPEIKDINQQITMTKLPTESCLVKEAASVLQNHNESVALIKEDQNGEETVPLKDVGIEEEAAAPEKKPVPLEEEDHFKNIEYSEEKQNSEEKPSVEKEEAVEKNIPSEEPLEEDESKVTHNGEESLMKLDKQNSGTEQEALVDSIVHRIIDRHNCVEKKNRPKQIEKKKNLDLELGSWPKLEKIERQKIDLDCKNIWKKKNTTQQTKCAKQDDATKQNSELKHRAYPKGPEGPLKQGKANGKGDPQLKTQGDPAQSERAKRSEKAPNHEKKRMSEKKFEKLQRWRKQQQRASEERIKRREIEARKVRERQQQREIEREKEIQRQMEIEIENQKKQEEEKERRRKERRKQKKKERKKQKKKLIQLEKQKHRELEEQLKFQQREELETESANKQETAEDSDEEFSDASTLTDDGLGHPQESPSRDDEPSVGCVRRLLNLVGRSL